MDAWKKRHVPARYVMMVVFRAGCTWVLLAVTMAGFLVNPEAGSPVQWVFLGVLLLWVLFLVLVPLSYLKGTTSNQLNLRVGWRDIAVSRGDVSVLFPLARSVVLKPVVVVAKLSSGPHSRLIMVAGDADDILELR